MIYKFEIYGRPKIKKLDDAWDEINKTYQMFGGKGRVYLNAPLGTADITFPKELSKEELEKIKKVLLEAAEKILSDVQIKLI